MIGIDDSEFDDLDAYYKKVKTETRKHQGPGRHSGTGTEQTAHAGLERAAVRSGDEITEWFEKEVKGTPGRPHGARFRMMLKEYGYIGVPTVMGEEEFEELWKKSRKGPEVTSEGFGVMDIKDTHEEPIRMWRGIANQQAFATVPSPGDAVEYARELREGDYHVSMGIHGPGIYAAGEPNAEPVARAFAKQYEYVENAATLHTYDIEEGVAIRMMLKPGARVATTDQLLGVELQSDALDGMSNEAASYVMHSFGGVAEFAILRGYDAVYIPDEERSTGIARSNIPGKGPQWQILNRTALIVEGVDR